MLSDKSKRPILPQKKCFLNIAQQKKFKTLGAIGETSRNIIRKMAVVRKAVLDIFVVTSDWRESDLVNEVYTFKTINTNKFNRIRILRVIIGSIST